MYRFPGFGRIPATVALFCAALTSAACAQRVAAPPPAPVPQVARIAPAPVVTPPADTGQTRAAVPPAPNTPTPRPAPVQVKSPPAPELPQTEIAALSPPKLPPVQRRPVAPPSSFGTDAPRNGTALVDTAPAPEPAAPKAPPEVEIVEPAELGDRYRTTQTASDDYASIGSESPTPDTALDLVALIDPDEPPAPQEQAAQAPAEDEDADQALAYASSPADEPAEPDAKAPDANPYSGGFADDQAYETAQLYQGQQGAQSFGYGAPAFDPNAPVTVAVLTPDSDSRASIRSLAKGLSQAAALSARELGNRQLVLRGYDTGGTPEKASLAAQQAIADGARLIIGPLFSTSATAVASVAQQSGVAVIGFTTDRSVLRRGVYSLGYLPDSEVERMVSFAAQRGIRRIGLLSPDTQYGGIVFRATQDAAQRNGVDVLTVQPIASDFSGASASAERFAQFYQTTPDVQGVLMATNGKPLQAIAAYLAFNDVLPSKIRYMGLGIWDDPETFREATLRDGWFPGLDPALKAEFESRYSAAYGEKPPAIAALAYDGVAIAGALLQSARNSGRPPFSVAEIERASGFRGMSGLFRLLPDGRNERLLSILKVGRRQFEVVDPAPTSFTRRLSSSTGYAQ